MTPLLIVGLLLAVVLLVGNTMLAVAFLRSRGVTWKSLRGREDEAISELHRRVDELRARHK